MGRRPAQAANRTSRGATAVPDTITRRANVSPVSTRAGAKVATALTCAQVGQDANSSMAATYRKRVYNLNIYTINKILVFKR